MWFRRIFAARPSGPRQAGGRSLRAPTAANAGPAELALSPSALRQLNRLQINPGRFQAGHAAGQRTSAQRRPAMDFREHRMYTPGDDVRFVDWKASARQEHVFIKQGEHLKEASVYILLDLSASMAWGSPPKSGAALALAAALGYMALAHGDRLVVLPINGDSSNGPGFQPLGPVRGKGQVPALLHYLRRLPFQGRVNIAQTLESLSRRGLSRGLVLVLTDLLGAGDLQRGLAALPAPAWNVGIFHLLHPNELEPDLRGDLKLKDIETGQTKAYTVTQKSLETYRTRLEAWRSDVEAVCRERRTYYTLLPTGWSLETEIIPHLREQGVLKSL